MAPSHPAPAVRCEPGVLGFTGASYVCWCGLWELLRVEVIPDSMDPGQPSGSGTPFLLEGDLPKASGFGAGCASWGRAAA